PDVAFSIRFRAAAEVGWLDGRSELRPRTGRLVEPSQLAAVPFGLPDVVERIDTRPVRGGGVRRNPIRGGLARRRIVAADRARQHPMHPDLALGIDEPPHQRPFVGRPDDVVWIEIY